MTETIDPARFGNLREEARKLGLPRLGIVSLEDPRFEPSRVALDRFLDAEMAGEMGYLERTRALRKRPEGMLPGARSVVMALVPYRGEKGAIARYAQWADYHTVIHRRLLALASRLETLCPGVQTLVAVDTKPILERSAAALAGLGFIGKHGCLIAPGLGSYVLLGGLLTTGEWEGEGGSEATDLGQTPPWDACGSCSACLDACPTQAFDAPGRLDPRRCISYLTLEHRGAIETSLAEKMGERIAGCDVCQEVCPYNQSRSREMRVEDQAWLPQPPGKVREVDLPRLATIGSSQHRAFVKHTALNRVPRRALRRNALIALGNGEGPLTGEEEAALRKSCEEEEEALRGVARWARERRTTSLERSEEP